MAFIFVITTILSFLKQFPLDLLYVAYLLSLGFAAFSSLLLYLNSRGYVRTFLWLIAIFNPAYLTLACIVYGPPLELEYLVLASLPISFMCSSSRHKSSLVASVMIHILLFYACTYYNLQFPGLIIVPDDTIMSSAFVGHSVVMLTIAIFIIFFNSLLTRSEKETREARQKSESLLLNILPEKIAVELKDSGSSKPRHIASATVLFTDFVGFTRIAESMSPQEVVEELDKCFSYFDRVTEKYNLEKLKTIGDSFMCAGGIPEENQTHAIDCCLAALEIQSFMNQMKALKEQAGFPYWELRLGMNTGSLVAGVVGEKKFAYDVWGDTVNTASRMESSGEKGKINVSRQTRDAAGQFFIFEPRGRIVAKNKGELEMYFLTGIKPEFSARE